MHDTLGLQYPANITLISIFLESRFKAKHSLDSDEEDEDDTVQQEGLGDEDLAAQEDTTIVRSMDMDKHLNGCIFGYMYLDIIYNILVQ